MRICECPNTFDGEIILNRRSSEFKMAITLKVSAHPQICTFSRIYLNLLMFQPASKKQVCILTFAEQSLPANFYIPD